MEKYKEFDTADVCEEAHNRTIKECKEKDIILVVMVLKTIQIL